MTWPVVASAILLLPSGHRAYDKDFRVTFPLPRTIDVRDARGLFHRLVLHRAGEVDAEHRALYVLGGRHLPSGYTHVEQHAPDEAYDQ